MESTHITRSKPWTTSVPEHSGSARDPGDVVEILSRDERTMIVRMDEHVDGEDVTITSRFEFEAPRWLTYEHLEGPFGVNRGRFTLRPTASGVELTQWHETEQDLDVRPTLRTEWQSMMRQMHDTIGELARRRAREDDPSPG